MLISGKADRVLTLGGVKVRNADEREAAIDGSWRAAAPASGKGSAKPYYRPGDDFIRLSRFEAFKSTAHFVRPLSTN